MKQTKNNVWNILRRHHFGRIDFLASPWNMSLSLSFAKRHINLWGSFNARKVKSILFFVHALGFRVCDLIMYYYIWQDFDEDFGFF